MLWIIKIIHVRNISAFLSEVIRNKGKMDEYGQE